MKSKNIVLIKALILGVIVVPFLFGVGGYCAYKWVKQYYYDELESLIIDRYLDGNSMSGAFIYDSMMEADIYKSGHYTYTDNENLVKMYPNTYKKYPYGVDMHFTDYKLDNRSILNRLNDANFFESFIWIAWMHPLKFIVLRKTSLGFEFIEEMIIGVGFCYTPLTEPTTITGFLNEPIATKNYFKDSSLLDEYVSNLQSKEYRGIDFGGKLKYNMLYELRQKFFAREGTNDFWGNKYYRLKRISNIRDAVSTITKIYGDESQSLYAKTTTIKYSIQECEGVLEDLFLKYVLLIGGLVLILWIFISFVIFCNAERYSIEKKLEILNENI